MFWSKITSIFRGAPDISSLLRSGHKSFDKYVYFDSLDEAIKELHRRRQDPKLMEKVERYLSDIGIPEAFKYEPPLVLFRQIASPSLETSRFLIASDGVGMKPLFLEYYNDKFTSNNYWKRSIGKLGFYEGVGKKGGMKISYKMIFDFTANDGKPFSEIKTHWGESLIDFHHRLFENSYHHVNQNNFWDGSEWLHRTGGKAEYYYNQVLSLFIANGILLENFILEGEERGFTQNVFLPIFNKLYEHFGVKPIIVALEPTSIESADFWLCQNSKTKQNIDTIIQQYND